MKSEWDDIFQRETNSNQKGKTSRVLDASCGTFARHRHQGFRTAYLSKKGRGLEQWTFGPSLSSHFTKTHWRLDRNAYYMIFTGGIASCCHTIYEKGHKCKGASWVGLQWERLGSYQPKQALAGLCYWYFKECPVSALCQFLGAFYLVSTLWLRYWL